MIAAFLGSAELLVICVVAFFLLIPFAILPAILSYILLDRIPPEHRQQDSGLALLLLIPVFSVIWAFFVYPKISDSLRSYFASRGEDAGDCGRSTALAACICSACTIVPFVGLLAGLAALVLLIIFFVKAFDLSGRIQRVAAVPPTTPLPPAAA
jgi:ABC-type phosphate transport system permease subunit